MLLFTITAYALAFCYVIIQGRFYWYWVELVEEKPHRKRDQASGVEWTVIVPARDEAEQIRQTLLSLKGQGAEIIVVNDHSTDDTASIVSEFKDVVLFNLPEGQSGKKAALSYAMNKARGTWIATVDADVQVSDNWLEALDSTRKSDSIAIAGPVMLSPATGWFERWQALDFSGMMLITGASLQIGDFAMGNGANLAFSRAAFQEVGGYESEDGKESVSGDDMVLLGKLLKQFPGQIAFAKTPEAIVTTRPKQEVRSFIQQRWRWSAKTGLNQQPSLTITLGLVWAFHLGLFIGIPLVMLGLMEQEALYMAWGCKIGVDYVILRTAVRHFNQGGLMDWTYPLQSFVHALYVAGIGTLSLLPFEFEWKGRKARR